MSKKTNGATEIIQIFLKNMIKQNEIRNCKLKY